MKSRKAREIQASIARVLLEEWDPIGVKDVPECRDEYAAYAGGVYRLLASGATRERIADHLDQVGRDMFNLADPRAHLLHVADSLLAVDVSLESTDEG